MGSFGYDTYALLEGGDFLVAISGYFAVATDTVEGSAVKSRTLRLPADQAEALEAIAGVDEVSVNGEMQRAIAAHIEARRAVPTSGGA